jgi:Fe-S cluster assembly protein SufD
LIVAEESSEAAVVEDYIGDGARYLTNAVSEVVIGNNAKIDHYKLQREGEGSYHIATVEVRQGRDSRFRSYAVSLGSALARIAINTTFEAEGGECSFDGLYMATGRQHLDHHTTIDHRQPRCTSRELYKGVLDGKATGVFNGRVYVRPNAQKSDATQMNKNLLLSDQATVDTKPQLEIFADDVKCSHGATIGQLDEKALFYLRSRGIGADQARQLLIRGFANELIDRLRAEPVRAQLQRALQTRWGWMSEGGA